MTMTDQVGTLPSARLSTARWLLAEKRSIDKDDADDNDENLVMIDDYGNYKI